MPVRVHLQSAVSSPSQADVPDELSAGFWKTVLVLNVALFGLALGTMLWVFERSVWAAPAVVVGAVAAAHAWSLYRRYAPRGGAGDG